jgi:DhnA family fructose-bisphosphate aldolase class Ia
LLSPDANYKVLVCTVEEAIKLGADGVSLHVNLGADREADMLRDFGIVSKKCQEWGMPLLVMMYTRGDKVLAECDEQYVKIAARVASEMGADMVKVSFTGSVESFARVVEGSSIPVLIAGGEKAKNTRDVLNNVKMAIEAGGKGVSMGRNVFQHENPSLLLKAVSKIVHDGASVDDAMIMLGEI